MNPRFCLFLFRVLVKEWGAGAGFRIFCVRLGVKSFFSDLSESQRNGVV